MAKLSVIIITKNEEAEIRECLQSVQWADEIIVVDSGSTDRTVEIAKEFTPHVEVTGDWPGFGPQKQRALDKATGDWVLSVDADERVPLNLQEEIRQAIQRDDVMAYHVPRLTYFCGHPVRHSGWYPDFLIRLFRREHGTFSDDIVHEKVLVSGATEKLKHHLEHFSYRDLHTVIERYNVYTDMGAEKVLSKQKPVSFFKAIGSAIAAFIKLYFLKRGFLDGKVGFVIAITSAETAFYKYLKAKFKQTGAI